MRFRLTLARPLGWVLLLPAVLAAPAQLQAQIGDSPVVPIGKLQQHPFRHGWDFHARNVPIPRTYSYYYATWFNQPRHFRVVGPDGKKCWRTTVRGLPLGTPWPSDGLVGLP
jgi:hypothetical protein